jgi:hypothetical protein
MWWIAESELNRSSAEKLNNGKDPRDEREDNKNNDQPFSDRPGDPPDKSEQHQDDRDDDENNSESKKPVSHGCRVVPGTYIKVCPVWRNGMTHSLFSSNPVLSAP